MNAHTSHLHKLRSGVLTPLLGLALLSAPAEAVELGQFDDFQDGTTQGWRAGGRHPDPPSNGADEGPGGTGDDALSMRSAGGGGAGSRLVAFNSAQWTGDYLTAGVSAIALDLRNDSPPRLRVRLALNGPGGWFVTRRSAVIPMSGEFARYILPVTPESLVSVTGNPPNVVATLGAVSELRLLHTPQPDFRGNSITAALTVDNVQAIVADACTLGGGARPTAEAEDDGLLLLPTVGVDDLGATTFMAIRNPSSEPRGVELRYFNPSGALAGSELFELGGREVRTFNLADVGELAPGDGPSRGWVLACADDRAVNLGAGNVPGDAARVVPDTTVADDGIAGDYFFLDEPGKFATGDRLLRPDEICRAAEARLLDFGSGAKLRFYLSDPRGANEPSATVRVYNQTGTLVDSMDLFTSDTSTILDATALTAARFGTLSVDFSVGGTTQGSGALIVEYSAFGSFSVGLNAECVAPAAIP